MISQLRIISYNCRGWRGSSPYVSDLLSSCDILLIQEHWLFRENFNVLNISDQFIYTAVSGMDSSNLLVGRPFGGCAIMYRKSLLACVKSIPTNSKRFCAVRLIDSNNFTIRLINVYMPTDYGTSVSNVEFISCLSEIEAFIDSQSFDSLIIGGDFNVDFSRASNNSLSLSDLMSSLNLSAVDCLFPSIPFTYMRDDGSATSWVDHFLCSERLVSSLFSVSLGGSGSNLSDHHPLVAVFNCSFNVTPNSASVSSSFASASPSSASQSKPSIAWHRASPDQVSAYCDLVVRSLPAPPTEALRCTNPDCTSHLRVLELYCDSLCNTLKVSAELTLPLSRQGRVIPGWNKAASMLKSKANFWHRVWREAGCPCSGVLFDIKRRSRSRFKYEVRRLRRREKHIRRSKLAEPMSSMDVNSFWSQVSRINSSKSSSSSSVVDSVSGAPRIANVFSAKLESLLNSRSTRAREELLSSLDVCDDDLQSFQFSRDCVVSALSHLKPGKHDGSPLSSDHVIKASPVLVTILPPLFTAFVRHSYLPPNLRNCILKPIPKPHKDPTLSDSYRPIALAPTLSKILEWCILLQYSEYFATSPLQFGFKKHMSTALCTGLVKNISAHYMSHGSSVFACLLDASKAFDLVDHSLLFQQLLQQRTPSFLVRFLISWYSSKSCSVSWDGASSDSFNVSNGIRQGGVLSPVLFTIYMDILLNKLKECGVGCYWDGLFVGALCYADDLILLAPYPSALRTMLSLCESFANSYGLKFNAGKTQLIRFGLSPSDKCTTAIYFCGELLAFLNSVCHLGHILSYNLSDNDDIVFKSRDLLKKANLLFCNFKFCNPHTLTFLFRSYCLSLYGCSLWRLDSPSMNLIEVAFNKILRHIWKLPSNSHTRIVHSTARLLNLFNVVFARSLSLLSSALSCPSFPVSFIYRVSQPCVYSVWVQPSPWT